MMLIVKYRSQDYRQKHFLMESFVRELIIENKINIPTSSDSPRTEGILRVLFCFTRDIVRIHFAVNQKNKDLTLLQTFITAIYIKRLM